MPTCSIPSCTNPVMAISYCMTHYNRLRRHGDVMADVPVQRKGLPKPLCQVAGCTNPASIRGHCAGHAKRLKISGDVQAHVPLRKAAPHGMPVEERLWPHVDRSGGPEACWPWLGRTEKGYGKMRLNGRMVLTHRLAYELAHGPLPVDAILDHVCHTTACTLGKDCPHRRCCNPRHLVIATQGDNVRRGNAGMHHREKTHCTRGHPYSPENTYVRADGSRRCNTCHRLYNKRGVPS